jgi:hypothetical protein
LLYEEQTKDIENISVNNEIKKINKKKGLRCGAEEGRKRSVGLII